MSEPRITHSTTRTASFERKRNGGVFRCTLADLRAAVEGMSDMPADAVVTVLVPPLLFGRTDLRWQTPTEIRAEVTRTHLVPIDADEAETVDEYDEADDAPVAPGSVPDPDGAHERTVDQANGVV